MVPLPSTARGISATPVVYHNPTRIVRSSYEFTGRF